MLKRKGLHLRYGIRSSSLYATTSCYNIGMKSARIVKPKESLEVQEFSIIFLCVCTIHFQVPYILLIRSLRLSCPQVILKLFCREGHDKSCLGCLMQPCAEYSSCFEYKMSYLFPLFLERMQTPFDLLHHL